MEVDVRRKIDAYSVCELKGDQSITDPLLPGFSSPVAAFFELTSTPS
jgi:hypothetical protein